LVVYIFFSAPETVEEIEIIRNGLKGFILGIKVVQVMLVRMMWVQQSFCRQCSGQ